MAWNEACSHRQIPTKAKEVKRQPGLTPVKADKKVA